MSGFRLLWVGVLLLAACGSGFLALVGWASEDPAGLSQGRSDDAELVMVTFGVLAFGCLLGAWRLMARGVSS